MSLLTWSLTCAPACLPDCLAAYLVARSPGARSLASDILSAALCVRRGRKSSRQPTAGRAMQTSPEKAHLADQFNAQRDHYCVALVGAARTWGRWMPPAQALARR